ncbi:titin-like isoform X2 [Phlebotomus papatasi]|uniref:titin-like isoform X2 n=1 Tax=Phlebotomus papatasi TaxID=29031 RepID=UPI0024839D81|nr:titin-like isoform X2 [Phlebotomus papatasi]
MLLDLKFSKFNDTPWGFRLTGGADFDYPLTVIKVTEGSLAATVGMKVGDIVVRINDTPASNLSHLEAHNVLLAAGNNFMLGVLRENEEDHDQQVLNTEPVAPEKPPAEISPPTITAPVEETIIEESALEQVEEKLKDDIVSDDQIAEIISSEAEALSLKTSEVFKTLNAEAVKTKEDKIQEERKWTTFLQKPNRPIPKSKWDLEQEKREPYRVKIVKQPKPKIAPDRVPTPPPMEILPDPPKAETEKVTENKESVKASEDENPVADAVEDVPAKEDEIDLQAEEVEELVASTADNEVPDLEVPQSEDMIENPDSDALSRELEEKLVDVQRQLLALSNLPHTIKATLDSVTEQLSKIVPVTKEESQEIPVECDEEIQDQDNITEVKEESEITTGDQEVSEVHGENEEQKNNFEENDNIEQEKISEIQAEHPSEDTVDEGFAEKGQETEEDLEHQQRLIRERTPKKPPKPKLTSAFGPLVPQERPIFLPGGRKWRKPKDAFNDEFIAEVLSSQAELIVGTTLGVNFLKYQKPEKKVDLRNSEVYRMIHRMDKEPTHGIAVRPEKVLTADDVHRCSSPLSKCGQ